jgi:hypothetical protein
MMYGQVRLWLIVGLRRCTGSIQQDDHLSLSQSVSQGILLLLVNGGSVEVGVIQTPFSCSEGSNVSE